MEYNKNIDLIFFPEENPYINYAVLFAKDFEKSLDEEEAYYMDKKLSAITIPYNINYDFVKTILSQSNLSKVQQERFLEVRFGSIFIPMEIEFEWYYLSAAFDGYKHDEMTYPQHNKEASFSFLIYENSIGTIVDIGSEIAELCLGIIQSYQVLSKNTPLNFSDSVANWNYDSIEGSFSYTQLFTPLPLVALATTQTNIGDYLVNVRDKPNAKEGKIIAQLLTQETKIPQNLFIDDSPNPLYAPMISQGKTWYRQDNAGDIVDKETYHASALDYYHYKNKQAYFKKEKQNLIHPLNGEEYLVLVWNIEPNNWAKVWILRMIREGDWYMLDNEKRYFKEDKEEIFSFWGMRGDALLTFINGSYSQTFLESPSTLKLYEGYIHCSGLQYLAPFTENYIKR